MRSKRLLATLLTLTMVVSGVPSAAIAAETEAPAQAEEQQYNDVEAQDSVEDGEAADITEVPAETVQEEVKEEIPARQTKKAKPAKPSKKGGKGSQKDEVKKEEPGQAEEPVKAEEENVEEVKATPSVSLESTKEEVNVYIDAPEGALYEDTELKVEAAPQSAIDALQAEYGDDAFIQAVDISFIGEDGEYEPLEAVNVKLVSDFFAENSDYIIVHVKDDGTIEELNNVTEVKNEDAVEFESDQFSTYAIVSGGRTTTVHYGYMNGNTFTEFSAAPSPVNNSNDHHAYLIYDFEGYQYYRTYYRTNTGNPTGTGSTQIQARLNHEDAYYNAHWQYRTINGNSWTDVANNSHIYVLYTRKPEVTSGGTPTPTIQDDQPEPADPTVLKESADNHDGTRTLSLSVTGHTEDLLVSKLADVIVIMDISGSMDDNMTGGSRISVAKTAVNNLATQLYAKNRTSGKSLIRMGLISFSNTATVEQSLTDNENTFKSKVNGLNTGGGTNWEQALLLANQQTMDSERASFIIFVSDGDPTFRISRMSVNNANLDIYQKDGQDGAYVAYNVFGNGSTDPNSYNYNAALKEAQSIVSHNKNFYTIGISNDVSKMAKLNSDAGGKGNYTATSSTELEEAFNDILESISGTLGWSANITDGITGLTNMSAKTAIVGVNEKSFKYYKNGVEWDPESEGAGLAVYNAETGAVEWNLGSEYQLDDGVTYKVSFIVWPSQTAIDYVTQLNNNEIEFNDLPEDVRKQVSESPAGSGNYVLKTNTEDAYVSYQPSTKVGGKVSVTGEPQTAYFQEVDPLILDTMSLKVVKIFTDTLTNAEDRETQVTLYLQRRVVNGDGTFGEWEDFSVPYIKPDGSSAISNMIVLSDGNTWQAEFYISPGLETDHDGVVTVYNPGYEFRLTEPNQDYHYELNAEIIKPMLVNLEEIFEGDADDNHALTAENIVKGGINIEKLLIDDDGNEITSDEEFVIKGFILDKDGNPYTFDPSWDDREDKSTATGASATWIAHQNDTGAYHLYDQDGNRIGYKLHFASTGEIELHLKPGMYARFVNVPKESTFEFYEDTTDMNEDYSFDSIDGLNQYIKEGETGFSDYEVQPTVTETKVSGTVYGNVQHSISVTNKSVHGESFYVYHSSDNTIEKIYADDDRVTKGEYDEDKKTYEYKFNIVNETKKEYLYGGYFKAYGGQKLDDDGIKDLEYNNNDSAEYEYVPNHPDKKNWASDTGATKYDGSKSTAWKNANAYTESGLNMSPAAGKVYYLKEVPDQYFRPALYYVYDKFSGLNDLKKLYFMIPTDDSIYIEVRSGVSGLAASKKLYTTYKVTKDDGTTESYNAVKANSKLPRGYLTVWDAEELIKENATYTMTPVLVTKDNIKVTGAVSRQIFIGNACFDAETSKMYETAPSGVEAFYVVDTRVASTASEN